MVGQARRFSSLSPERRVRRKMNISEPRALLLLVSIEIGSLRF